MIPEIYTGTAGWSYKDWVPDFYPLAQSLKFDWLQFYALYFNCVEVNASYYAYMNPKVIDGWIKKVEEINEFLFSFKLHQDFTHKKDFTQQKIKAVAHNLDMLAAAERLGGLLIQFPYSFVFTAANLDYLRHLCETFENYPRFVEIRHSSWNNCNAYEFMVNNNVSFCTIDQPAIGSSVKFKPVVTNDTAYIRFHGRNEEAWKQSIKNFGQKQTYEEQSNRYKYFYSPGELNEIDVKIKEVYDKVKKVFVIMNNHPAGYAVANAFELMSILKNSGKIEIPETILKAFPRLGRIAV
jgi:uncharacterized protein YecE (DUF72 family)